MRRGVTNPSPQPMQRGANGVKVKWLPRVALITLDGNNCHLALHHVPPSHLDKPRREERLIWHRRQEGKAEEKEVEEEEEEKEEKEVEEEEEEKEEKEVEEEEEEEKEEEEVEEEEEKEEE